MGNPGRSLTVSWVARKLATLRSGDVGERLRGLVVGYVDERVERQLRAESTAFVLGRLPAVASITPTSANLRDSLFDYLACALPFELERARRHAGRELCGKLLAWHLAYDLHACVVAFERTHDRRFLDLFTTVFDDVVRLRDCELGKRDDVRGRVTRAWGSNRYTRRKALWTAVDAFTGMLLYPAAMYCRIVEGAGLDASHRRKADQYLPIVEDGLGEFAAEWRKGPGDGEGYYVDPDLAEVAPLNHMLTLGRVHLELARVAGESRIGHLDKAQRMAAFFKRRMRLQPNDSYIWTYWPKAAPDADAADPGEDVTHAQINMHFALLAHAQDIAFDRADMHRIANTLRKNIVRETGDWAANGDGTGALREYYEGLMGWAVLAEFDAEILPLMLGYVRTNRDLFPLGWFSYATGAIACAYLLGTGQVPNPGASIK